MPEREVEKEREAEKKKRSAEKVKVQKKWPATVILLAPFTLIFIPLYRAARHSVNWAAAIAMIVTFEIIMFLAEYFAVSRGHWIWNPNRIIGPTIFSIPIEEPLLYYWFPPLLVVVFMHAVENRIKARQEK